MKSGPIILIEDDHDDKTIFEEVLAELGIANKLIWFSKSKDAIEYLQMATEPPFLILSDVNMPVQNGLDFKKQIDNDPELRKKSIPFVFYSTSVGQQAVKEAYTEMTIQGFFQKGNDFEEIKNSIKLIIDYWTHCIHPNS